ncbi:radical SAM/SPASM domain-containing protein [Fibrobacter sp.]|uniref:radical SAM/SPASM domain-containing protein n=1 Tax=Fibrobacter sp. TaxID=35828 RepID=UPI003864719D
MNAVYIEITDVCNLNCSFCPCGKANSSSSHSANRPREFMSTELFEKCIEESATVAENVFFHVLGEPTLHPGFGQFLKRLEQTPLKLNLTTNGTTIARVGKLILASPAVRQVNFSTHAYAELPQDEATRHLQDVLDFCKMANAVRPDLYINLRLWNVGDAASNSWNEMMLAKVNEAFGNTVEDSANAESGMQISLEHFCSRHKSFNVVGRIYLHQDSRFEWPEKPSATDMTVAGTCRALDTHVAILHDGRVVACCLDYSGQITLGNIADQSLAEILESPAAKNLREGFEKHELRHPLCQSCTFCKRFGK